MSRKVKRINGGVATDSFEASYNETNQSQDEVNNEESYTYNRAAPISSSGQTKYDFNDNSVWLDQTVANKNNVYENEEKEEKGKVNKLKASEDTSNNTQMSALINKLFPSIRNSNTQKPDVAFETAKVVTEPPQAPPTSRQSTAAVNSSATSNVLVKEKLKQLEAEIEKFQEKNVEIDRLKEKLQAEIKLAETSRRMASKQKEEELARLKELHEEEVRKFRLEKKVFEQYKQSMKDMPTRKERDEIDVLKKQVNL
jgi:hypothetical protein